MVHRIASYLKRFVRESAVLALSLTLLTAAVPAQASCDEFLFSNSQLNEQIYRDSFTQTALPMVGALPEEVLAIFGRAASDVDLFAILRELKITRVRWGSSFKVKGGLFRRGDRILVLKHHNFSTPERKSRYVIELAQALFAEKQRQLRFSGPLKYTSEMDAFGQRLEAFVVASEPGLTKPKFNYVTYGLRSLFGFIPGAKKQWPATKPRLAFHWTLTRAFAGILIATMAMNVSDLPQAVETFQTVWEMRDLMDGVVQDVSSSEFNFVQDRLNVISSYEARILALEEEIASADPANVDFIKERIATFKIMIESLRADLAKLPPT